MSWAYKIAAASAEAAKAGVDSDTYEPPEIKAKLKAQIDAMPLAEGEIFVVESHGHYDVPARDVNYVQVSGEAHHTIRKLKLLK